ncbi:amidohydrolase [Paracoccus sp. S1E-3]|uniref:amidohydrolase family protein n=1 Tax=Paracoccus sp. S1E-3 TaxID=2756130 RepID=UPI001C68C1C4|nr:amidohydrolase family protein [Paracoccus sp. S1E-3]
MELNQEEHAAGRDNSAGEAKTIAGESADTTLKLPEGSCDCHVHIYGPFDRFPPYNAGMYSAPEEHPVEALLDLWDRHGIARGVIVHALGAGPDNAATYDALRRYPDRLRGVAILDQDVTDKRLNELNDAGFRGVRINLFRMNGKKVAAGGMTLEDLEALAPRLGERGWHAQLWIEVGDLAEIAPRLEKLPLDYVVDHMGRTPVAWGVDNPGTRDLVERLKTGRYWAKISGADRNTQTGAPYTDVDPFMRTLVEANPDRLVWGTDWPHVGHTPETLPQENNLIALLRRVVTDEDVLHRILVQNPRALYGF